MYDLLINGKPLDVFGGMALLDYSVGEATLSNATFQGVDRTSWHLLKTIVGRRELRLTLIFTGADLHAAKLRRSYFNGLVCAKTELFIVGDGFFYDAACKSLGVDEIVGQGETEAKIKATYSFDAVRRGPLQKETIAGGGAVFCQSTTPFTDARLTVTVGATASSYTLGGATFGAVEAGDVLVFDGINGAVTVNGVNAAAATSWINFPSLVPGENTITALDPVTVEYFPVFI